MSRKSEFKDASKYESVIVNDSRFGHRKLTLNREEAPSVFSYANPGRAWWGTR